MLPESSLSSEKLHANVSGSEVTFPTIAVSGDRDQDGTARTLLFQRIGVGIGALPQDSETASIETEYEQAHRVAVRLLETDAKHGQGTDNLL